MLAFVFPGQGTQRVGMGAWLYHVHAEAREVFDAASARLGYAMNDVCFRGPQAQLTATQYAQPAVFTCSAAGLAVLRRHDVRADIVAGHSVGELTALFAAGVLDFDDALAAVARRADLMARTRRRGTMAAVIGLDADAVEHACEKARAAGPVTVAVHNGDRHIVISGATAAVEAARREALEAGALKCIELAVSHAFHSELMDEVVADWSDYVETLRLHPPRLPIALNTTGDVADGVDQIRAAMVEQVSGPVRWVQCVRSMRARGVSVAVEVGDSKALCGFNRGIDRAIRNYSLAEPGVVERLRVERSHAL